MSNFINNKHRLVIIHIPKCGGSSIRKYSNIKFSHKQYFGYIPKQYLSYYKVGFCRHPIERFISAFKMFRFGTSQIKPILPNLTIDAAIQCLLDDNVDYEHTLKHNSLQNFKHHAIPITHKYNCIKYADKIIRFEQYNEDIQKYLVDLGIPIKIQKTNYTEEIQIKLNDLQIERLANYYKTDFQTLGYENGYRNR